MTREVSIVDRPEEYPGGDAYRWYIAIDPDALEFQQPLDGPSVGFEMEYFCPELPSLPAYLAARGVYSRGYLDTARSMTSVTRMIIMNEDSPYVRALSMIEEAEAAGHPEVPNGSTDEAREALLCGRLEETPWMVYVERAIKTARES